MIDKEAIKLKRLTYGNLFIIEDKNNWANLASQCNKEQDLVLCIDFSLKKELEDNGFAVAFLDHLIDENTMQVYNTEMHSFLNNWFRSASGENLLLYKGFNIGDALLVNLLNDITYFCRFFFSLLVLKHIQYQTVFVCLQEELVPDILNKLNIPYTLVDKPRAIDHPAYFFPISRWMNERINKTLFKHRIKDALTLLLDHILGAADRLFKSNKNPSVYIHAYHPTFGIIDELKKRKNLNLILNSYTGIREIYRERRVVFHTKNKRVNTSLIIENFDQSEKIVWRVGDIKLSDYLYELIRPVVINNIDTAVSRAEAIQSFFKRHPIKLMVPVTNLWLNNRLIMQYCLNNRIPIFMIINGLLVSESYKEATDSNWINCYSESIKHFYFKDAANAVPLGDPRMDTYAAMENNKITREKPTIVIGAAGFSPIDLNSYLAYEFDFLYDILKSISAIRLGGRANEIILKVRANGYVHLYSSFINEYFPSLDVRIEQTISFIEVIKKADLYISFYSQTIFEASSIGVPTIYYKKDNQIFQPPYDAHSEMVTVATIPELQTSIEAFYDNDDRFKKFMDKRVLEKYIGNLDGKNTQRNVDFINSLVLQNISSNTEL